MCFWHASFEISLKIVKKFSLVSTNSFQSLNKAIIKSILQKCIGNYGGRGVEEVVGRETWGCFVHFFTFEDHENAKLHFGLLHSGFQEKMCLLQYVSGMIVLRTAISSFVCSCRMAFIDGMLSVGCPVLAQLRLVAGTQQVVKNKI